jgi:hypothetical protein
MENQNISDIQVEPYMPPQPQMQSSDIGKLAEALAKAQAEMSAAKKDAKNPFFKSDYATLHSCLEAGNPSLNKNGLCVTQLPGADNGTVLVETILMHTSGQFIKSRLSVKPQKTDPQALGSCLTYLRRYSYSAIIGQGTADDDSEAAMSRPDAGKPKAAQKKVASTPPPKPKPADMKKFLEAITKLTEEKGMSPEIFDAFMEEAKVKSLEELKTKDAQISFYNDLKKA